MRIFISYSSNDFAIAEAAAAVLRRVPGVDPWLDVLRLRPGEDWQRAINESIDRSDAVLLLASPDSLRSEFVVDEWTRAQDHGVPVHVGVVRGTRVPSELARRPRHDLRVRFEKRLTALATGTASRSARALVPGLVPLPVVAVLVLAVLTSSALARIAALVFGRVADHVVLWGLAAVPAVLALVVAVSSLGLLTRRATVRTLGAGFALVVVFGVVFLGLDISGELARLPGGFPTGQPDTLGLATIAAAILSCAVLLSATSVRRWLPSGHGGDADRWVLGALTAGRLEVLLPFFSWQWEVVRSRSGGRRDGPTVRIDHAPADRRVARFVERASEDMGFTVVPGDADWELVLVSSHRRLPGKLGPRAVCVLLDSVEVTDELRRRQWVDFRQRSADHLHGLLSALRGDWRARAFLTPMRPLEFRAPIGVLAFVEGCREFMALIAGAVVGTVVTQPFTGRVATLVVVSALLVACTAMVLTRTTTRRFTAFRFVLTGLAASLVTGWWSATWLWVHWGRLEPTLFPQIAVMVVLPLGLPIFLAFSLVLLWHTWLPTEPGGGTVGPRLWTPVLPLTFVAGATLSAMAGFSPS